MEVKWLQDFMCLANTGSFSQAAKERFVTQSTFSRRIRALEHWLGTPLVDRSTHPVSLTDSGTRFVAAAEQMIRLAYKIRDDFDPKTIESYNQLTFSVATNLAVRFFPRWLRAVEPETGPIRAWVRTDISGVHSHFDMLSSQASDLLIHYGKSIDALAMDSNRYSGMEIGRDTLYPVCRPELRKSLPVEFPGDPDHPIPYVSPWPTSMIANVISEWQLRSKSTVYLEKKFQSSILGATHGLVMERFGMAWLPESMIHDELKSGALVALGEPKHRIPLSISLYRSLSNTKPNVIAFCEQLERSDNRMLSPLPD